MALWWWCGSGVGGKAEGVLLTAESASLYVKWGPQYLLREVVQTGENDRNALNAVSRVSPALNIFMYSFIVPVGRGQVCYTYVTPGTKNLS